MHTEHAQLFKSINCGLWFLCVCVCFAGERLNQFFSPVYYAAEYKLCMVLLCLGFLWIMYSMQTHTHSLTTATTQKRHNTNIYVISRRIGLGEIIIRGESGVAGRQAGTNAENEMYNAHRKIYIYTLFLTLSLLSTCPLIPLFLLSLYSEKYNYADECARVLPFHTWSK